MFEHQTCTPVLRMLFLRTFLEGQESGYEPGCQAANTPGKSAADLYFSHIIPGTRQLCGRIIENLYIELSRLTLQSKTWVSSHPLKVFHLNGLLTREIMIYSLNILHSIDLNIASTPLAHESRKVYWECSIPLELDRIPYRGYCVKSFRYSDKKANLSTMSMCTANMERKIQRRYRNKILLNSNNAKHGWYIKCSQNGLMHHITIWLSFFYNQKLIRGWNVSLAFNAREYSLLPYLETLVTDIHFQQMAATRSPCRCFKRGVLCFKVKNTPSKDKKWKEKVQKNAQLSSCGEREAFHQEIVLRGIQPCFLHDRAHGLFWNATKAVKFLLNFQVHFALYGQDNYVFERDFMYF